MKYPTKLSDAVHILAFIALHPNCSLTSEKIAESVQTNAGYVRQLMSALRRGGLLLSVKGHPRPSLAKTPGQITLLDVYRAVEGGKPLLHQDTHTNPACGCLLYTSASSISGAPLCPMEQANTPDLSVLFPLTQPT